MQIQCQKMGMEPEQRRIHPYYCRSNRYIQHKPKKQPKKLENIRNSGGNSKIQCTYTQKSSIDENTNVYCCKYNLGYLD